MNAEEQKIRLNPRKVFWQRGACSNAMFYLLNNEFDNVKLQEEKAADMLAGGIAQKGHQCGMLWGFTFFTLKTICRGFIYSPCFNLIVKWTPEAVQTAKSGLSEKVDINQPCLSCAAEVVRRMGGTEEESVMVAGFAGGIGLSGNTCGALGAAVWYKMLDWGRKNPGQTQAMFENPDAKKIIRAFYIQTDSEVLCSKICNKKFETIDEHSEYVKNGGCKNIIEALASA